MTRRSPVLGKFTKPLIRVAGRAYKIYSLIEPAVESERCLVLVAWLIDKRKISGNCFRAMVS